MAVKIVASIFAFIFLVLLLRLLTLKTQKRRDVSSYFVGFNYAHRGYHNGREVPENSLTAFNLACEAGFGIELDVQLSKDGEVVVFHDETLNRVCAVDGKVRDYTLAELRTFSLLGCEGEHIPTFSEVLSLVGGRVPILVEIKAEHDAIITTEKAQKILDTYTGKYLIESFNPLVIKWYRKNRPDVVRGILCETFSRDSGVKMEFKHRLLQGLYLNFPARPDFLSFNYNDSDNLAFRITKKLYKPYTFAWTVRDKEAQNKSKEYDALIFENLKREDFYEN